jgi:hypothetical protein
VLCLCGVFSAAAEASSLVGEWPLESSTVSGATEYSRDASGNGLALASATGSMHFGTEGGKFGGYLAASSATTMQVTSPLLAPAQLTLLAWVKQNGFPGLLRYIAGRGNDGPTCGGSSYALYTGYSAIAGLHFYVRQPDAAATPVVTDSPPDSAVFDGNWHLVAGTYDGASIHLYVDGVEVGSPKSASGIGYASPIADPSFYVDGYPPQAQCLGASDFPGQIDDVQVYDRALTASELQRLTVATAPVAAPVPASVLARAGKSVSGVSKKRKNKAMEAALNAVQNAGFEGMASVRRKSLIGKPKKVTGLSGKQRKAIDSNPRIQARLKAMKYGIGMKMPAVPGEVVEVAATVALEKEGKRGVTTQTIVLPAAVGSPRGGQKAVPLEIPIDAGARAAMAKPDVAAASISIQAVALPSSDFNGEQSVQFQQLSSQTSSNTVDFSELLGKLQQAQKAQLEADRRQQEKVASRELDRVHKLSKEVREIQRQLDESSERFSYAMDGAVTSLYTGIVAPIWAITTASSGSTLTPPPAGLFTSAASPTTQLPAVVFGVKPCEKACRLSGLIKRLAEIAAG